MSGPELSGPAMSGSVLAATACAMAGLWLLRPVRPRLTAEAAARVGTGRARWLVPVGLTGLLAGLLAGSPRLLVLALVAAALAAGGGRLWSARRRERSALATRSRVVELCDGLRAELASGQTPTLALERAGTEWPLLAPVARTARSGGDVPVALRALAAEPGAGELRIVAAAWQVAHRTGHGLADALGRVADDLRATEQTRRVVAGELASARATARLLAGLPLAALLMGTGAGGDPWRFLVGTPPGLACLVSGLGCGYAGLVWIDALARDVERGRR